MLGHETVNCLAGLKSSKFFGETSKKHRRKFEGTLKETSKYTSKFFEETFFNFFRSSDFLRSILLIGEFQIFVVEYSNIRTYSNYSNFLAAPERCRHVAVFMHQNTCF